MKKVHAMPVPKPQTDYEPKQQKQTFSVSQGTREFVNYIFIELQSAKPAWRLTFPNDQSLAAAKVTWMKALVEGGITDKSQIAQGLRMARKSETDFFPSVGKFIAWCQTSALVPDRDSAFALLPKYIRHEYAAIPREVKAMFDLMDRYELRTRDEGDIYRAFKRNYKFICEKLNKGESIDEFLIEKLPKPKEPELSFEEKEDRRLRILAQIQETKKKLRGKS
ncbi:replication protein P [Vibrio harveyi]|uniref:replication protein P n=1 Tax=Vibrio harveyi TaxID=669 RepID=UPI003CF7B044